MKEKEVHIHLTSGFKKFKGMIKKILKQINYEIEFETVNKAVDQNRQNI